MSTKPPTAVMMPRVSSSGFKSILLLLKPLGVAPQLLGRGIVRQLRQCLHLRRVRGLRLTEPREVRLDLLPQPLVHAADVDAGNLALARLLVDERPFGGGRSRVTDILKVGFGALGTARQQGQHQQQRTPHAGKTVLVANRSAGAEK